MPYPVQNYAKQLNQFCVVNDAFTQEEVDQIVDLEDLQKFTKGRTGGGEVKGQNTKMRDSEVMWVAHDQNSDWLYQKFSHLVSLVNNDHFMYDLDSFENFQYTRYRKNEHYNWHVDVSNVYTKFERKISATVLLSDPKSYEGGEFECVIHGRVDEPVVIKPNRGDIVFFASWMPHRVRPVTSGVRKSLVCWIMGKRV
jgi:PKHD-type hydroxylase